VSNHCCSGKTFVTSYCERVSEPACCGQIVTSRKVGRNWEVCSSKAPNEHEET